MLILSYVRLQSESRFSLCGTSQGKRKFCTAVCVSEGTVDSSGKRVTVDACIGALDLSVTQLGQTHGDGICLTVIFRICK